MSRSRGDTAAVTPRDGGTNLGWCSFLGLGQIFLGSSRDLGSPGGWDEASLDKSLPDGLHRLAAHTRNPRACVHVDKGVGGAIASLLKGLLQALGQVQQGDVLVHSYCMVGLILTFVVCAAAIVIMVFVTGLDE